MFTAITFQMWVNEFETERKKVVLKKQLLSQACEDFVYIIYFS